jgi:hypothetical protein
MSSTTPTGSNDSGLTVERVSGITARDFDAEYVAKRRPVVVTDALTDWKALGTWSPEYFRNHAGSRSVKVLKHLRGSYFHNGYTKMELSRFLDQLETKFGADEQADRFYLSAPIRWDFPELESEVGMTRYVPDREDVTTFNLYIGHDSVTPCHFHPYDEAFVCCLYGLKKVVLFPPDASGCLYPLPLHMQQMNFSRVNFDHIDEARFPLVKRARSVEVTVEPGDMLYIPPHWWHLVRGSGLNISLSVFWVASLRYYRFQTPGVRSAVGLLVHPRYHDLRTFVRRLAKDVRRGFAPTRPA